MKVALQRLDGVVKVAVKRRPQMFAVVYSPGASFQPQALRDAVSEAHVQVVRFHVSALGEVEEKDDKQFFISGKDRFLVVDSPKLPTEGRIGVMGEVDDSTDPFQLKVSDFRPLTADKQ